MLALAVLEEIGAHMRAHPGSAPVVSFEYARDPEGVRPRHVRLALVIDVTGEN